MRTELITHRRVLRLAWPITVGMLSHTMMALADTLFVGHLGTDPLAAVGLAAVVSYLFGSVPFGLYTAVRVRIARAWGASRTVHARRYAWQGLWLVLPCAVGAWAAVGFARPLLALLGAEGALLDHGAAFLEMRLAVMPLLFAFFALQAWFQGRGETRIPMVAVLVGNAVNIALDPVLIHGWFGAPALGVAGASAATGVAWAIEVVVLVGFAWRALTNRRFLPDRVALGELVHTGAPMAVRNALDVLSFVLFATLLASVGEAEMAAHVIVVRILAVSFLPGDSLAQAAGVLVGQRLGAGDPDGARQAFRLATVQASTFMAAMGMVFLAVPEVLVGAFGPEPHVADLATAVLGFAALVQIADAVGMVAFGALNGAGDTRFTMVAGLGAAWLAKIPVALLGVGLGFGLWGAWLGIASEMVAIAVLGLIRVRGTVWLEEGRLARAR